ncbi:unnamed protein product, partial [Iphiclides podalirius]
MEAGFIPVGASGNAANNALPPAVVAPPVNVIRAPGLKRGKMEEAISDRATFPFNKRLPPRRAAEQSVTPETRLASVARRDVIAPPFVAISLGRARVVEKLRNL